MHLYLLFDFIVNLFIFVYFSLIQVFKSFVNYKCSKKSKLGPLIGILYF